MRGNANRGQQGRPSTEQVTKPENNGDRVKRILWDRKRALVQLFPKDGEAAVHRAIAIAMDQARRLKEDVDPASIAECAVAAMRLDIEPGPDCYMVPFKGKATFIVGPQGLIKLMFRSGFVKSVMARSVLVGDEFDYQLGSNEFVKHKRGATRPINPQETMKALVAAYAVIETTLGGKSIEVLERGEIDYYRSLSPSKDNASSLWNKFPAEAARKAALKQDAKFVPHSAQMAIALRENEHSGGIEIPDEIMDAIHDRTGAPVSIMNDDEGGSNGSGQEADNGSGYGEPPEREMGQEG